MLASRRHLLATTSVAAAAGLVMAAASMPGVAQPRRSETKARLWRDWVGRFLADDGRVLDTGNGNISHTEGQGTAMMGAVWADDRDVFDRAFAWLDANLRDPDTGLYSWRYDPAASPPISDPNNATDGDLMIAWALHQAGLFWDDAALLVRASELAAAIFDQLARPIDGGLVLLPGRQGFERDDGLIVNLSYAIFPAFDALAAATPDRDWVAVREGYARLISVAQFGRFDLPPDWVLIKDPARLDEVDSLALPEDWPPRFSYDAIRVPLYLVWGGYGAQFLAPFVRFWRPFYNADIMPPWTDLTQNTVPAEDALPGFYSVRCLTAEAHAAAQEPGSLAILPPDPPVADDPDYYSASLTLLSAMAADKWGVS
ncbi:MAG: glycosyl hydrolase family 8 [Pseudomonadota bacterium]